jgi:probable rRNA maturation factor
VKPGLQLLNRQRKRRVDLVHFRAFAESAMVKVTELLGPTALPKEISVVFVSDARIANLHRDFMSVDKPTDVITFHHGEIVISVETAERQGKKFSTSFCHELRLYFVHALLHLAGYDDLTPEDFEKMVEAQQRIVQEVEQLLEK